MDNNASEIIEKQKEQCIFCKIINGEVPTIKVYEDDIVLAIMDIYPANKGHVLLMPKKHYPLMPWIPRDEFKHLFKISRYLSRAIEDALGESTTIFIANGGVAGQQSTHFMIHIMPKIQEIDTEGDNSNIDSDLLSQLRSVLPQAINQSVANIVKEDPSTSKQIPITEEQKNIITSLFNSDPEFKKMILNDPEGLKQQIKSNPELDKVFQGINIDALSYKLKSLEERKKGGSNNV